MFVILIIEKKQIGFNSQEMSRQQTREVLKLAKFQLKIDGLIFMAAASLWFRLSALSSVFPSA